MICFPNAKMNLGLNTMNERPDGYHNIETIFYPVPVRDALEAIASDQTCFTQTGIPVDAPQEKNLVIRALNALKTGYEIPPLKTHSLKAIPLGTGFGGGSADTAFMLKLANDFCGLDAYPDGLEAIVSTIGADYPFFVRNTSVSVTDTGNQFRSVNLPLRGYYSCLVKPDAAVSTPEAYSMVIPAAPKTSSKGIIRLPVSEWKERMMNDLEWSIFPKHPMVERIKDTLYEGGALYAATSDSGSSVFNLFEKPAHFKGQSLFSDCFLWEGQLSQIR